VLSVRAGVPPAVQPARATPAARAVPAAATAVAAAAATAAGRLVPATSPAGTAWARAGDADPAAGSGSDRADPAQRAARALLPGDRLRYPQRRLLGVLQRARRRLDVRLPDLPRVPVPGPSDAVLPA